MNQRGRDALRAAGLAGVRQITGILSDRHGGLCALGVLAKAAGREDSLSKAFDLDRMACCHLCTVGAMRESSLLAHMNDWHDLDFLGLAEKMPVTDAP